LTGPTTRSLAQASGLSDRDLRHPGVERISRDTYLPRALSGDLHARMAAVLLNSPPGAVVTGFPRRPRTRRGTRGCS